MNTEYPLPVNKLLTYGDCRNFKQWPNYLALGFTPEHIPELIRMTLDADLRWADSDSLEVWAPVHAWRALGQLRATEAIAPLLNLFHGSDEDDEWASEELPVVYGMIGSEAIPALTAYLADSSHPLYPRVSAAASIGHIGEQHPAARLECIMALTRQLERFSENSAEMNAFLIGYLMDLKAVESIALIREAFAKECVDYTIEGDIEDVEIELGLRQARATPANYPTIADKFPPLKKIASTLERMLAAESNKPRSRSGQPFLPAMPKKAAKIGRNDPCPCGSGKKYKKCCLNKPVAEVKGKQVRTPSPIQPVELSDAQHAEISRFVQQNNIIQAIKRVREFTGVGLKEAKDYVDHLRVE